MSRATVRSSVATWITGTSGISTVYTSFPKVNPAQSYTLTPGTASGCVAIVFLADESETREALGGATNGQKRISYTVNVQLFHRSVEPTSEAAMNNFDSTVENLKVRLRLDHTFGNTVWQAAEPDIVGEYGEPILTGDITETWGALTFSVTEWVNA